MAKIYRDQNVLEASKDRIKFTFDNFDRIMLSFSGGKDSSLMFHLVAEEARARKQKFGVMIVDLEAQYKKTIDHIQEMLTMYEDCIEPYWICLPMNLRNAASNFDPKWKCWDPSCKDIWVAAGSDCR